MVRKSKISHCEILGFVRYGLHCSIVGSLDLEKKEGKSALVPRPS